MKWQCVSYRDFFTWLLNAIFELVLEEEYLVSPGMADVKRSSVSTKLPSGGLCLSRSIWSARKLDVFDGSLPVVSLKRVCLAVSVYFAIALSVMLSCALFMYISGTTVGSGVAALFVTLLMMWGPFLGRIGAVHLVDQSWKTPFSLRKWGLPRAWVIGGPLSLVLVI
jgi:hypothetical protein